MSNASTIKKDSPEGRQMTALAGLFNSAMALTHPQTMVNGFAYFYAMTSLNGGLTEDLFNQSITEFADLVRLNRANLQKEIATAAGIRNS